MYIKNEVKKCLDALTETDAKSSDYSFIIQNLSYLMDARGQIQDALDYVSGTALSGVSLQPEPDVPSPEEAPAQEPDAPAPVEAPAPAKTYTKAELRKALYNAKKQGFDVVDIYQKYSVTNINDLPESAYAEIVEEYGDAK